MTPHDRRHHLRALVFAMLGVTSALLIAPLFVSHPSAPRFCSAVLPISTVDGQRVVLQDQGKPGRHEEKDNPCSRDFGPNGVAGFNMLGFDCKLRDASGAVVGSSTPNRTDGTCGQPD